MNPIARFVVRPDREGRSLLLLGLTRASKTALKAGCVYEIREFDGEFSLENMGPSCISSGDSMPVEPGLSWARNVDGLIECCGKLLIYTLSEYLARRAVRDAGAQS